jgi:glycerol uptake facilitator-like aquaporin
MGMFSTPCRHCAVRGRGVHHRGNWFTASTSFANPAVTFARAFTDTFAGIRLSDVPAFVVAQLLGAAAATLLFRWLVPALPAEADDVVVPHQQEQAR